MFPPISAVAAALKPLGAILAAGVTIPVWAIIAAGLWFHFDKGSEIRQAVDRATKELVAGAEIAAMDERIKGLEKIAAAREARAAALEAANRDLRASLEIADQAYQDSLHDLEELAAAPPPDDCRVGADLLKRMRNR